MPVSARKRSTSNFIVNNKLKLVHSGAPYFSLLLQLIENARDTIHLQTYIFDEDETGTQVADALIIAAKRGVKVYLLVDGYASQGLSGTFIAHLKTAGIHFRFFQPIFKSKHFYFGRRLHHKVTVIDAKYALVGGINIANHYNDRSGQAAWLDFALHLEGEIVTGLCKLCWETWKNFPKVLKNASCDDKALPFNFDAGETSPARIRRNDWIRRKIQISGTYKQLLLGAESHVIILSSYFIPGYAIRHQIKSAIKRGTRVTIIIAGISDVSIAKNAERFMYKWLLKHHVEIYEYSKNILHGKIATCDGKWMTLGSFNVNDISAHASIELNIDVKDQKFVNGVVRQLEQIIAEDCTRITKEEYIKTTTVLRQFVNWFSYQFIQVVFYLFTFYVKPEKTKG